MTNYELFATILASGSLLTGIGTIIIAILTNQQNLSVAKRQIETDKNIARRQGVFELHNAWKEINELNPTLYVVPDVINAINALSLTASIWNHDVLEKELLFQSYWEIYKSTFEKINIMADPMKGVNYAPNSKLSPDIIKAYNEMRQKENFKTFSTNL